MPLVSVSRQVLLLLLTVFFCNLAWGKPRPRVIAVAWNEDTLHSYLFTLKEDCSFEYTITDNEGIKKQKQYEGRLRCMIGRDTVYLAYAKNKVPPGLMDYLVIEVSGKYLIQSFSNTKKRIFMRRHYYNYRPVQGIF